MGKKKETNNTYGNRVYLGASLPFLATNTLFEGNIPKITQLAIRDIPEIERLIVPIDKAYEIRQALQNPHSVFSYWNKKIIKERNEKYGRL